jgi:hypothetical protein
MDKILSPIRTIRAYCLGCSDGSFNEVKICPCTTCELYPYRLGRRVNGGKRVMSEEQKSINRERLAKARELKKNG